MITLRTSERKIFSVVGSAMLPSYDVFDVKTQQRAILCEATILAAMVGSVADNLNDHRIHQEALRWLKNISASVRILGERLRPVLTRPWSWRKGLKIEN